MITHHASRFTFSTARLSLLAALLAATLFRALPLLDNRFHPDEALYASFALRIAAGRDPLLSGVVVDKPPLPFYLAAVTMLAVGKNELAARLPSFYASVTSVALTFTLARRLYGSATAQLSGWLLALSPFAILFSITVFIDPLLTVFVLWGLWRVTANRPRWGGVAFALAFAVKQTALLFVPLAFAFALLGLPAEATVRDAFARLGRAARPLLISLLVCAIILFGWDYLRHAPIGFWEQGYTDNVPGRLIRANEVLPRALAWLDLLHYFTGSWPANLLFIIGLPALLFASLARASRASLADLILAGFLALYLAVYWLSAFAVFDRYLVPSLPFLALLLARVIQLLADSLSRVAHRVSHSFGIWALGSRILPIFCLLLLPPALTAAHSGYPIGGDHGAYDGIDDAARFIHTLPDGSVLYDHWLSWEWNFYLFDGPVYISWFPSPAALATDLAAFGRSSPRFFAVPSWESDLEMRAAAQQVGFAFIPLHTSYRRDGSPSFVVYQLQPIVR